MRTRHPLLLALIALATTACVALPTLFCSGAGRTLSQTDEEISTELRSEMLGHRDEFIDAVRRGDEAALEGLLTEEARKALATGATAKALAVMQLVVGTSTPTIESQHYVRSTSAGNYSPTIVVLKPKTYTIQLPPIRGDAYVFILSFEKDHGAADALELLYVKEGPGWRLQFVDNGILRLAGKRAEDWFEEAKQLHERGALVPAALRMRAASKCLRPVPALQYGFENDFRSWAQSFGPRFNERFGFPSALQGSVKPTLHNIDIAFPPDGHVPVVGIVTSLSLEDAAGLKTQAADIENEILARLPGLCDGATQYSVKSYAEAPDQPTKVYRSFGVLRPCPTLGNTP